MPLEQITGVAYWVTKHLINGVPSGTERFFVLYTPRGNWKVPLHTNKMNKTKKTNEAHYDRLVGISAELIEPRLRDEAFAIIERGGEYTVGTVTVDQSGIRSSSRLGKQSIAWPAVDEANLDHGMVVIKEAGDRRPISLSLETCNAVIVARLIPLCAQKFG